MRRILAPSIIALALSAACSSPEVGEPQTALFVVPRGAPLAEFYQLPFPNDLRRDQDGHPMLADYPRRVPIVNDYLDACQTLDGFGTNNAIFTRYSGAIDVDTLPADPAASLAPDASVYLVDVDPSSPYRGQRSPLVFRFQDYEGWTIGDNWLSALPSPGFPLHQKTTYALVVTTRLRAALDADLLPDTDFAAITAGAVPGDPYLAEARAVYQPLLDWLDEPGGDERADVVSAAVFTTQSVTDIMAQLRERIRTLDPPAARDLVRVPIKNVNFFWYDGLFDAPNFQTGQVPYLSSGGDIVMAADGLPEVQRMEELRFSFTVPDQEVPPEGWPVVIYAHGTGGSYHSFVSSHTALRLANQGMAVISIDQVLHGPRNPGSDPDIAFFNFQNPYAARNNAIQGALDDFSVVRLIENFGDWTDPGDGASLPRTIRFDPTRIYFFGHSQGGLTGPPFVAYEPLVKGAILSGAGGLLYYALLNKTEPVNIADLVHAVIIDNPLDEFNPVLAILQMWVERSDTINYGPLLVREPPSVGEQQLAPRPIYQSMGFIDHYTPLPTIEALAVAIGGDQVAPVIEPIEGLALRGRGVVEAPVANNLDGTTAVLVQYQATTDDGHFVVFDVPAAIIQSARFLGTLARTGTATLVESP